MRIAPSILAADTSRLAEAVAVCESSGADLLHFDVMDGHFVPNLSFGVPVLAAIAEKTTLPIDVHLMVANPDRLLDSYLAAGPAMISVHWEACLHLDRTLDAIHRGGAKAGVALNPATPVELLRDILPRVDFIVLMSVNPGFAGQRFLPYVLDKARRLRTEIDRCGAVVEIEFDGGIGPLTIADATRAGADICVAGSAVFGQPSPAAAIARLKDLASGKGAT